MKISLPKSRKTGQHTFLLRISSKPAGKVMENLKIIQN